MPAWAQTQPLTPEKLWQLGRASAVGLSDDQQHLIYRVTTPDVANNTSKTRTFRVPLAGGTAEEVSGDRAKVRDAHLSPDGRYLLKTERVRLDSVRAADRHPDLPLADAQRYDALHHRHWDTWSDGHYQHLFVHEVRNGQPAEKGKDLLAGEPYHVPTMPFGGDEDYTWSPDSRTVVYVAKKQAGTDYVRSTNTDLYAYDVASGQTTNLTEGRPGYDTHPRFTPSGHLAWLSMARDGFEADKNDLLVRSSEGAVVNLTANWDGTVNDFAWAADGRRLFFTAPHRGTIQLFEVDYPGRSRKAPAVRQLTEGDFDVNALVGQAGDLLVVGRADMNRATEFYTVALKSGQMRRLTRVNDDHYAQIAPSKIERRLTKASDGQDLFSWVIYPPDFDPNKKYPTLLYCQGGPQSALTQFYSFRWNFQLMAAQGYIVVAPNRRGMPGWGAAWNEAISKDWGGQVMRDYLAAIDDVAREPYVDKDRLGCVGASYGGYSAFYLAGIHEGRFKTFIAHAGVFNLRSMYGTTEELFFVNWDIGGPYWDEGNPEAQRSYRDFDPSARVGQWDTPILIIHGGKDYRVPLGQGLEAFTAAQMRGIPSRLLYFPEENHWILRPQNAQVWQREFFGWLKETL